MRLRLLGGFVGADDMMVLKVESCEIVISCLLAIRCASILYKCKTSIGFSISSSSIVSKVKR